MDAKLFRREQRDETNSPAGRFQMISALRPYQVKAVDDVHASFVAGKRAVCFTLPTGGGKTVIFTEIARRASAAGTRTAILVHRDTLLLQASRKLYECGIQHGIIAPGHSSIYRDMVHVASVHTLARRLERHEFDLIIVDEAHHSVANTYKKILARWPEAHVLGVTATPCRTDGAGLESVFEQLVLGPSIQELVHDGYLVDSVVYGAAKKADLGSVHTRMGDYDQKQLAEAMDKSEITGDAVEHYAKYCPGAPAVAFCVNVKHAEDVAAAFAAAGFRALSVDGSMPVAEIRRRTAGLADGSIQVLASCDLVSEGFDAPALTAAILLRPTKSLAVYLQQVGRALRPVYAPGFSLATREGRVEAIARSSKPHAIILDHTPNTFRFGFADDEREWTLEGRKKRSRGGIGIAGIAARQCPECFLCHKPAPACPECGHSYVVEVSAPEAVDGELSQLDKDALRRAREKEVAEARTYDQLKEIGRRRGYKPQWAWKKWCERDARLRQGATQ